MTIDDLKTAWLARRPTETAALPGLCNLVGSVQVEADITAIQHPVFPPYSAGNEITARCLIDNRAVSQSGGVVRIRWRAHRIERRAVAGDWSLDSETSLGPDEPSCLVRVRITNRAQSSRTLDLRFLLSGRARNTGYKGYSWGVPSIPTDVFGFTNPKHLQQHVADCGIPGAICIANEERSAFSVQGAWPAPDSGLAERKPRWRRRIPAGGTFTVALFFSYAESAAAATRLATSWWGRDEDFLRAARQRWDAIWLSAFTPGNTEFSGHLPRVASTVPAVMRLYYAGILTLLTCRRRYAALAKRSTYLTIWPRRGEGSVYFAWDLPYTSGILARLDPEALRTDWTQFGGAVPLAYQVTNLFEGSHQGHPCCAHFQAAFTAALNLWRWTGDRSWERAQIVRKTARGSTRRLTGRAVFAAAVSAHRTHRLPGSRLADFGDRGAYLEAVTTYAFGTAGLTAAQAWGVRESAGLGYPTSTAEAQGLEKAVLSLYRQGQGYFDCRYRDGSRVPAPLLYDIGLVLNHLAGRLPERIVAEIVRFVRDDLRTTTWCHNLAPGDLDALSGTRCDHQWAGCFPAWIPQFALGAIRAGSPIPWLGEWLEGVSRIPRQGPFGQAYWADDSHPAEAEAAAKCFDELPQGNHWVISSGAMFAEMVLDGICGLTATSRGELTVGAQYRPFAAETRVDGILHRGRGFQLAGRRLTSQ